MLRLETVSTVINAESKHEPLSLPEKIFLDFIHQIVKQALMNYTSIYIGVNKGMQSCFHEFVIHRAKKNYNKTEFDLDVIVTSVWMKTKRHVEQELKESKNQEWIWNEKKCQEDVNKTMAKLERENKKGKVFTARQAKFLLEMNASSTII